MPENNHAKRGLFSTTVQITKAFRRRKDHAQNLLLKNKIPP